MFKILVLISGNGTTLQHLIDNINNSSNNSISNNIKIVGVISNKKNAFGLTRAKDNNISTYCFPFKKNQQSRESYDTQLANLISNIDYDLIVCAGWMHILNSHFLTKHTKIINIHPALPNSYKGMYCIKKTFEGFKKGEVEQGGVMVHWVIPDVDAGEVISQYIVQLKGTLFESATYEYYEQEIKKIEKIVLLNAIHSLHDRHQKNNKQI